MMTAETLPDEIALAIDDLSSTSYDVGADRKGPAAYDARDAARARLEAAILSSLREARDGGIGAALDAAAKTLELARCEVCEGLDTDQPAGLTCGWCAVGSSNPTAPRALSARYPDSGGPATDAGNLVHAPSCPCRQDWHDTCVCGAREDGRAAPPPKIQGEGPCLCEHAENPRRAHRPDCPAKRIRAPSTPPTTPPRTKE